MGRDEMKQVFPGVIVPDELKERVVGCEEGETVPEAQARAERVAETLWKRARGSGLREKEEEEEEEKKNGEDKNDDDEQQKKKKRKVNEQVGDLVIVSHGMFTDTLLKILSRACRKSTRETNGVVFCSQNAGIHAIDLDVATEDNVCGLVQFNDVRHIPIEARTGGSVFGLDECYVQRRQRVN